VPLAWLERLKWRMCGKPPGYQVPAAELLQAG
jgi:hypothetical protein